MTKLAVALGFLALNFWTYHFFANSAVFPPRAQFAEFPLELGEWACPQAEIMDAETEQNLGVTDYLLCTYRRSWPSQAVNVYVGYHATQVREEGGGAGETSIHPPAHCLPGSGWDIIDSGNVELDFQGLPGAPTAVKRLVIAKGELRQLTYYWYQSRGRVIADDWKKILYVGWDRATRRRTDGSLVRFTTPIRRDGEEDAEAAFRDLAPRILAVLPDFVPE